MNNLFFTALCLVLLYYFFFYLPSQKNNANLPFPQNQATQTDFLFTNQETQTEPEIELIDPGSEKDEQITSLKEANQKLLEEVNLFQKNKELIKEAVEAHQDYISHFLPTPFTAQKLADTETKLKEALEKTSISEEPSKEIESLIDTVKNGKTLKECQELLKGLAEKED